VGAGPARDRTDHGVRPAADMITDMITDMSRDRDAGTGAVLRRCAHLMFVSRGPATPRDPRLALGGALDRQAREMGRPT
jgi:hypothetical protein